MVRGSARLSGLATWCIIAAANSKMIAPVPGFLLALLLAAPALAAGAPVRVEGRAYGLAVTIELRDLPPEVARAGAAAAMREIAVFERETEPGPPADGSPIAGTLAALNAAAGKGPQAIEPRLFQVLARAADFCAWSNGAHGPLARDLYRLWGRGAPAAGRPDEERLAQALRAAACGRLALDPKARTASLEGGGGVDLGGFAEGAAVDRAVAVLQEKGARNGVVEIGRVWRAWGSGPDGKGWRIALPALPGMPAPIGEVLLLDQALALVAADDRPLSIAGDTFSPLVDQRTGRPVEGMEAVAVRTLEGMDAEALAGGLFILGTREGQLRVGSVRPLPAVLWALGSGAGAPLLVEYHWSATAPKKPAPAVSLP
jgi:thiamine biosynthesis lipoprotein